MTKQIETAMLAAIAQGGNIDWKQGNTRVHAVVGGIEVQLHGNTIAAHDGMGWTFNLCGWNTPTTRSRINAIASAHGVPGVFTKAGKPLRAGVAVPDNGWF